MESLFIEAIRNPKETFAKEKSKGSIGSAVKNYLIAGAIIGIIAFLISILENAFDPGNQEMGTVIVGGILGAIFLMAILIFIEFLSNIVSFVIAKVLGGKGSFTSLFYLNSLYAPVMYLLSYIPFLGLATSIYGVYLFYLAVKESQELSSGRAIVTTILPVLLIIIILAIAIIFLVVLGGPVNTTIPPYNY